MKITWSPEAVSDYETILEYLYFNWSEFVAQKFSKLVAEKIVMIQIHPLMFEQSLNTDLRKAKITKHISLFYQIKDSELILLRFWNNNQNPEKISL